MPGAAHRVVRMSFLAFLALCAGFYDGFLGPGTGAFLLVIWIAVGGLDFLHAAASGRILNFASNVAGLVLFASLGLVDYSIGLPMLVATLSGGYAGSRFGMRLGVGRVRWLFVTVTGALALRLAWGLFGP